MNFQEVTEQARGNIGPYCRRVMCAMGRHVRIRCRDREQKD